MTDIRRLLSSCSSEESALRFHSYKIILSLALNLFCIALLLLWLSVPFVTAAHDAHSRWSSYHSAIFHISHIRSPYLSSSARARHAKLIQAPHTCAEFSEQRSQRCEIHIDFIRYSVFACNRIGLIPFSNNSGDNTKVHVGADQWESGIPRRPSDVNLLNTEKLEQWWKCNSYNYL